ncbi:MAG: hypothetical protein PHS52_08075 [Desulfotomaculaceae bacterium]|nr:hypothetical protein [Desulfotomaculaceae bacterium]
MEKILTSHQVAILLNKDRLARFGYKYLEQYFSSHGVTKLVKKKQEFKQISNWKQWSAVKKAALAKFTKLTKRQVKSLVSWQVYRKEVLGLG